MPTPADQRLMELLDKWLSSLELHLKYSTLDDETYWKMQPWVEHQRPNRWIVDLAKQKTLALRKELQKRIGAGDAGFSDALELMTFLANLVGSQHIERFIPLADPDSERWVSNAASKMAKTEETREMPRAMASGPSSQSTGTVEMLPPEKAATATTATREMPRFAVLPTQGPPPPVTTLQVTRLERKGSAATPPTLSTPVPAMRPEPPKQAAAKVPAPKSVQKPSPKSHPKSGARGSGRTGGSEPPPSVSDDAVESVIADAVRLMQWGRKWYELAELISRMADRPALPDVRRILKDRKSEIEKLAGR
jgi:hypothetical protein